jgi:Cu(I)/Ag(I) efflux system membrane protein CusA/SilA
VRERVRRLNWELEDRAPGTLAWSAIEAALGTARREKALLREPASEELLSLRTERERALGGRLALWPKLKADVQQEMDTELQVPGWGNIWTQPIINRVDMLSTGVRTMIGVKVFGPDLDGLQKVSNEIARVLTPVPGAVDVLPDQIVGENYLEIAIDRQRAARYGVSVQAIQDAIEVALGGKEITMTVEGRARFPVRVRYPRDLRTDEDSVRNLLVAAGLTRAGADMGGGAGAAAGPAMAAPAMSASATAISARPDQERKPPRLRQVPLSMVADVRLAPGPSMIKSENGLLRSYVQLNVRGRDIVGFVEEAKAAVAAVELPPGFYIEWSGQFEHQARAQRTLMIILPMVILTIFIILFLTYRDLADTAFMFLAVPGAVAGGALAQLIAHHLSGSGFNFSVAVWVGYIICFGLATETSIVMLVYLREAIDKRGGLANIASLEEIKAAVMEGAVHRLRPKLLTEGTTVLALIPMLWATGVGSEFIQPMAVPILGGILVADEVVDILIPVLFYLERCRRWRKLRERAEEVGVASA